MMPDDFPGDEDEEEEPPVMKNGPDPPPPAQTPRQQLRQAVNEAGVSIVAEGFQAIDDLAEMAKRRIKAEILKALTGPRPRKPLF